MISVTASFSRLSSESATLYVPHRGGGHRRPLTAERRLDFSFVAAAQSDRLSQPTRDVGCVVAVLGRLDLVQE